MDEMKEHRVARESLIQVYEHCPRRPYLELVVPPDCAEVTAAVFTTVSRDQGWAGDSISYTWFEVTLRRPGGRADVGTIRVQHNRAGNPEFFEQKTRLDVEKSGPRIKAWLRLLRPGDVIQLVPKAVYRCWVNIIQRASIEIEYRENTALAELGEPSPPLNYAGHTVYPPLNYEAQEIRVLVVEAGEPDAEIKAQFEHVSLRGSDTQISKFDALSYCWGEPTAQTDITLMTGENQESTLPISPSVKRAIRRLRKPDAPLYIWIDAVCINQADLEERANQVALMGRIYSRANEVHVWLDEEILGLAGAFRLIRDVYNCKHRVCPGGDQCQCLGTKHFLTTNDLDTIRTATKDNPTFGYVYGVFDRHRDAEYFDAATVEAAGGHGNLNLAYILETFFHHPWFQRVWVVQEAILAPKTTLHSASEAIDWSEVLLVNEVTSSVEFASSASNLRMRNSMPSVWKTLVHAHQKRTDRDDEKTSPLTILQVFLAALDMKATDPRDKLYALLPFGRETGLGDIPPALKPDYNKPLARVLADFTRWWITEYNSLDILSLIHRHPARAWRRTLCDEDPAVSSPVAFPTWAIGIEGYSQWSNMTLGERFPSLTFRASGDTHPDQTLLDSRGDDNLELALTGWRLGSIVALGHPPKALVRSHTDNNDSDSLNLIFHRIFDPSGRTGEWMLLGIFDAHVDAHYGYLYTSEQMQYVLRPTEGGMKYERHEANDLPGCVEKCFFVMEDGRRGLCPWTAREGDVVVILKGGNVPYLLRLVEGEPDKYVLVGECFVQGVMQGEVVQEGMRGGEVFLLK
ncbi:heterokaryon incompatibility protein-domain-containing protein [Cercophora newfieldiana]|uniref:Heterokaryon incompatibility protein-domain-containing protein n=1 Tax=Cercophora newfieldiana TaxID=92897 RepID=A0AA40CVV1_9PEZI|nr:heterokaryon incompatibility protein-domain-containing protein [Cercophora newfieldiana]